MELVGLGRMAATRSRVFEAEALGNFEKGLVMLYSCTGRRKGKERSGVGEDKQRGCWLTLSRVTITSCILGGHMEAHRIWSMPRIHNIFAFVQK